MEIKIERIIFQLYDKIVLLLCKWIIIIILAD